MPSDTIGGEMYRPEGMKRGIEVRDNKKRYTSTDLNQAFEAGADAMLEGLRKDVSAGHTDGTTKEYTVINFDGKSGTFVFIPEDE